MSFVCILLLGSHTSTSSSAIDPNHVYTSMDEDDGITSLPGEEDDDAVVVNFGGSPTERSASYTAYSHTKQSATNPNVMFRRPSDLLPGILY